MAGETPYRFPHDPALVKLIEVVRERAEAGNLIHDINGYEKTLPQLLGDVIKTTQTLQAGLPPTAFNSQGVLHQKAPYVTVLTCSGYDFIVAFFAIRAIGGACVPLSHNILPEEAHYFLERTNTTCILVVDSDDDNRGADIVAYTNDHGGSRCTLPISMDSQPVQAAGVEIDDSIRLAPEGPGIVLFTSGTTGRPKGVILPRICFTRTKFSGQGEAAINHYPAHWVGGARTLIISALTGKNVYTLGGSGDAKTVLETFKKHLITSFNFNTRILGHLKELMTDETGHLPQEKRGEYASWFRGLRELGCSGGVIDPSTKRFWLDLTGVLIHNVYTGTELGAPVLETRGDLEVFNLMGTPARGVDVKLSEGSNGEILVKGPSVLIGYAGDEQATRAAFNEEGYYKTGDLAEIRDGQYYFVGRENSDFALFGVYRVPLQRVEQALAGLPYVSEACVLSLPDHESRELCAAIVRVARADNALTEQIDLARIRSDLMESLPSYMLPAALRILQADEQIPRTVSGKAVKRAIRKDFFATTDWWPHNNPPSEVEYYGNIPQIDQSSFRPWDWSGVQRL